MAPGRDALERPDRPRRGEAARQRRRPADRPHATRVLAARVPPPAPRPRPLARSAARSGVATRGRRDAEHRRRLRHVPAPEAGRGRRREDRDGPRNWLSDGRSMTGPAGTPGRRAPGPPADAAAVRRVRTRLLLWSGG